jgi:hypothetical protein
MAESYDRLHVTYFGGGNWEQEPDPSRLATRSERIARDCAGRACGLSKFGCPTCVLRPSLLRHIGSLLRLPRVLTPRKTRISSMPSLMGERGEAWRDLDGRGRQGLRWETPSCGSSSRRPFRHDRLDHRVRIRHRPNRCSSVSPAGRTKRWQRPARCLPTDGGQDHDRS